MGVCSGENDSGLQRYKYTSQKIPLKNGALPWYRIWKFATVLICGILYHRILLCGVCSTKTMTLVSLYNEYLFPTRCSLVLINIAYV